MRSSFVPKSQPKITEISDLEVYYFKVSTKEKLSSCKKNIDSLFVLTINLEVVNFQKEISVIFGWDFGTNDDLINSF